jgi:putative ABC transport system permease protein
MNAGRLLRGVTAPFVLARRRLRSDPFFWAALFVAVTATAFLLALAPQLFDEMTRDSLESSVGDAHPLERNLAIVGAGRIGAAPGADPTAGVIAAGESFEERLPASVRAVIDDGRASVESLRSVIVAPPGEPEPAGTTRYLTLRHLEDAANHLHAAEGAMPTGRAEPAELPFSGQGTATGLEIALSATTAKQLSVGLGDRIYVLPAPDDPLARDLPLSERRYLALDVTGILEGGPGDQAWVTESRLGRAAVRDTETTRFVYGYGLVSGDAYNELLAGVDPAPLRYEWQHAVDPAAVAQSDAGRLAADLRQIDAVLGESTFGQRLGFGVRTGLGRILDRYEADRLAAGTALAVGAISLLAVALTVLGVLGALAAERRAETITLLRSRGGSLAQTLATQAAEGLLVALPAAAVGYVLATLTVGRAPSLLPALLALAAALAAGALLAGLALGPARRALAAKGRDDAPVHPPSPVRLALEALVIVASLAGVYLLMRRGLSPADGVDPFLAAVPILVSLAVGLLAVRLYPLPLRALATALAPRPDLVPAFGVRRLARQPSLAAAPFVVVLLAASSGAFTATLATTLAAAQEGAAESALTPLNTDTLTVLGAGIAVAGGYAVLALLLAPLLTARYRVRDIAYLRALGLSRRDVFRLAVVELGLPVAAAVVVGIVLGVALAYLVEPGLDLSALAAGEPAGLRPAVLGPALFILGLALVTLAVTALVAAAAGRVSLARVLRMGER